MIVSHHGSTQGSIQAMEKEHKKKKYHLWALWLHLKWVRSSQTFPVEFASSVLAVRILKLLSSSIAPAVTRRTEHCHWHGTTHWSQSLSGFKRGIKWTTWRWNTHFHSRTVQTHAAREKPSTAGPQIKVLGTFLGAFCQIQTFTISVISHATLPPRSPYIVSYLDPFPMQPTVL